MPRKVYCVRCRFLRIGAQGMYWCNKARSVGTRTWLQETSHKETPQEKNASNDCPDFKPKPDKEK